jgi:hypothetical protein
MKTIVFCALQTLLGLIAIAAGLAKFAGVGWMVGPLEIIGLGHGFVLTVGTVEIIAGLCMLVPRAGMAGAMLLSAMMVVLLGAAAIQSVAHRVELPKLTGECSHRSVQRSCGNHANPTHAQERRWSI